MSDYKEFTGTFHYDPDPKPIPIYVIDADGKREIGDRMAKQIQLSRMIDGVEVEMSLYDIAYYLPRITGEANEIVLDLRDGKLQGDK